MEQLNAYEQTVILKIIKVFSHIFNTLQNWKYSKLLSILNVAQLCKLGAVALQLFFSKF